jgi:hypothetical protein
VSWPALLYFLSLLTLGLGLYRVYTGSKSAKTCREFLLLSVDITNGNSPKTMESLLENLGGFLAELEEDGQGSAAAEPDPALLESLFEACRNYNTPVMEKIVTELEKYAYESGAELIQWLRKQLNNVDYEVIQERLEQEGYGPSKEQL